MNIAVKRLTIKEEVFLDRTVLYIQYLWLSLFLLFAFLSHEDSLKTLQTCPKLRVSHRHNLAFKDNFARIQRQNFRFKDSSLLLTNHAVICDSWFSVLTIGNKVDIDLFLINVLSLCLNMVKYISIYMKYLQQSCK